VKAVLRVAVLKAEAEGDDLKAARAKVLVDEAIARYGVIRMEMATDEVLGEGENEACRHQWVVRDTGMARGLKAM
jgi:hypothetical protein